MWVCIRRRELALVSIEVYSAGKSPSLVQRKRLLVLLQKHLRLDVPIWSGFHQQVIVELHAVEHARII